LRPDDFYRGATEYTAGGMPDTFSSDVFRGSGAGEGDTSSSPASLSPGGAEEISPGRKPWEDIEKSPEPRRGDTHALLPRSGKIPGMAAKKKRPLPKKKGPKKKLLKKLAKKKPAPRKKLPKKKPAPKKRRTFATSTFPVEPRTRPDVESGDLQGLSNVESADSESVDELLEEGNAFEAEAVKGVEDAGDADEKGVRTHEVPEDDVPGEYLDEEQ